jgi:hypothetical protein
MALVLAYLDPDRPKSGDGLGGLEIAVIVLGVVVVILAVALVTLAIRRGRGGPE